MDEDLVKMDWTQLHVEAVKLRRALRLVLSADGHDLCWFNPEVWEALPEKERPDPSVPGWCEFMQNCAKFRQQLEEEAMRHGKENQTHNQKVRR